MESIAEFPTIIEETRSRDPRGDAASGARHRINVDSHNQRALPPIVVITMYCMCVLCSRLLPTDRPTDLPWFSMKLTHPSYPPTNGYITRIHGKERHSIRCLKSFSNSWPRATVLQTGSKNFPSLSLRY